MQIRQASLLFASLLLAMGLLVTSMRMQEQAAQPRFWLKVVPPYPEMSAARMELRVEAPMATGSFPEGGPATTTVSAALGADGLLRSAGELRFPVRLSPGQGSGILEGSPLIFQRPARSTAPAEPPKGELWVEVALPKKGALRPLRLGVKQGGAIVPLAF